MDLTQEFQKYVGITVKDPERMTCDCDTPQGEDLTQAAQSQGLTLNFIKSGTPVFPQTGASRLDVHIEKDAKTSWGWNVQKLEVKRGM